MLHRFFSETLYLSEFSISAVKQQEHRLLSHTISIITDLNLLFQYFFKFFCFYVPKLKKNFCKMWLIYLLLLLCTFSCMLNPRVFSSFTCKSPFTYGTILIYCRNSELSLYRDELKIRKMFKYDRRTDNEGYGDTPREPYPHT